MPVNRLRTAPSRAMVAMACALAGAFAGASAPAHGADVVVQPSSGSALIVTDSAGGAQRLRVQEDGRIAIPGWQSLAQQTGPMCIDLTLGYVGPCPSTTGFSLPYEASVSATTPLLSLTQLGNGEGISVETRGNGLGILVKTPLGTSIHAATSSMTSAAIIGDNSVGEAIVGRQTGSACNSAATKCAGIGAVVGRHDGEAGAGIRGFVTHRNGAIGVLGQAGIGGGQGVAGRFENENQANTFHTLEVSTKGSGAAVLVAGGAATQDLVVLTSSDAKVARIDMTGRGFFNNGTQTGGADIAELIDTRGPLPQPGDVVEIDPDHALHYRLSHGAQSTLVAGVVTTRPGVLMNAGTQDATGLPALALAGRVPVKITLEGGPIRPGDLLVTATLPGHAARAPAQVTPGTVIGKALQGHAGAGTETGLIEMLVMLR